MYAHFGSREGILTAVAIEGFPEMGLAYDKVLIERSLRVILYGLEVEPQRQLDLAWRSRAHGSDRIDDGGVQVHRVDDGAET